MAGGSLLTLIDDITSVLDDVAVLTKLAAKKTAGVLGDDLALNAQQVTGVDATRELPVVWAVAKGSLRNKAILVPAALAISALIPWAVVPLLMIGGAFLCYEGFEKVVHKLLHDPAEDAEHHQSHVAALVDPGVDLVAIEKDKIKGAIRTDFILSAEIIAITLGTVAASPFVTRVTVLTAIALVMTAGVYGFVAGIVKLDDAGLHLSRRTGPGAAARFQRSLGAGLLKTAPYLMKGLSIAGTVAMFLVGGGILTHGVPALHHLIDAFAERAGGIPGIGGLLAFLAPALGNALVGVVAGAVVVGAVTLIRRLRRRGASGAQASQRAP
jgi:predicted DNA repair protein MutK